MMVCSGQEERLSVHKFVQLHPWLAVQGDADAACEYIGLIVMNRSKGYDPR
jgi:hypothetical protein